MIYVLGPSHVNKEYTSILQPKEYATLFGDMILDGYPGLPVWSSHIPKLLEEHAVKEEPLVWIVSDWKFNNKDYNVLSKEPPGSLARLDTLGSVDNIHPAYMKPHHIKALAEHSMRIIDDVIAKYLSIRLIFWCLYYRSRARTSSYPFDYQYTAMKERYPHNIVDIDQFTNPAVFMECVADNGAHPNKKGYELLSKMIRHAWS